jgi:hypothetical protein
MTPSAILGQTRPVPQAARCPRSRAHRRRQGLSATSRRRAGPMPLLRRPNGADRPVSTVVAGKPLGLARQLMNAARSLPPISALLAAAPFASATENATLLSRLPPARAICCPRRRSSARDRLFLPLASALPSRRGAPSGSPSATLAPTGRMDSYWPIPMAGLQREPADHADHSEARTAYWLPTDTDCLRAPPLAPLSVQDARRPATA